jgi:acyl-coenzyme A synthetase/AMP-(fatty) acid ligase
VLISHPLVVDAAVIGIPAWGAVDGEAPRAYIVRKSGAEGQQLQEEEVKQYIANRLAKSTQLSGGVVFVEEIPKTASGKYLKRQLRDRAGREVGMLSKL